MCLRTLYYSQFCVFIFIETFRKSSCNCSPYHSVREYKYHFLFIEILKGFNGKCKMFFDLISSPISSITIPCTPFYGDNGSIDVNHIKISIWFD